MIESTPLGRRQTPPPAAPIPCPTITQEPPVESDAFLRKLAVNALALALFWLVTWLARRWLDPALPVPPMAVATSPSTRDHLAEQEQLEHDIDAFLARLEASVPAPVMARVRQRRVAFGDGRLLRQLSYWLAEDGHALPVALGEPLDQLLQRWLRLEAPAVP
jgi:hypothetical protein